MAQTNLLQKTVLDYQVTELLGSGAFGTVYKVVKSNESGQYTRALKHITIPTEKQYASVLNSMGGDVSKADNYFSEMLKDIVREIRILNDLSEKGVQHIVRYYENHIEKSKTPIRYNIYILMEYITPLEDYIAHRDFTVRDVVKLGLDVLEGLKSCHINNVIHRDIKEDNIFVSDKGEYKIGDFGVSKVLKDNSKAKSVKGSPNYLAPEVYLGKEGYTKSVDLYSLGIVLYRFLNYSRNPFLPKYPAEFKPKDDENAFDERLSGKIPDLPSLGGSDIGSVIVKAISGASDRFATADDFIRELKAALSQTSDKILSVNVNPLTTVNPESDSVQQDKRATIGEKPLSGKIDPLDDDERKTTINKHLFLSISEKSKPDTSDSDQSDKPENLDSTINAKKKKIKILVITILVIAILSISVFAVVNIINLRNIATMNQAIDLYNVAENYFKDGAYTAAFETYKKSADKGCLDALTQLGYCYYWGYGTEKDVSKGIECFQNAANRDNAIGQAWMGYVYIWGESDGITVDYIKGKEYLQKSSDNGSKHGQYFLGLMYFEGIASKTDLVLALHYFELAEARGHAGAQEKLGYMYYQGIGVHLDYKKAFEYYEKSANQKNAEAQAGLGYMYINGIYVEQDYEKAFELFELSAEQENSTAQLNWGYIYDKGLGIEINEEQAASWYLKSANNGNDIAMYNLGEIYYLGFGVEKDTNESRKWYEQAATLGNELARKALSEKKFD